MSIAHYAKSAIPVAGVTHANGARNAATVCVAETASCAKPAKIVAQKNLKIVRSAVSVSVAIISYAMSVLHVKCALSAMTVFLVLS